MVALAAHSSTPRGAERDRAVTPPAAYDDRPVMIISTTSRKRLKQLRADARHDDHDGQADHGDHHHQDIRAGSSAQNGAMGQPDDRLPPGPEAALAELRRRPGADRRRGPR